MEQLDLVTEAERLRDQGMKAALANEPEDWKSKYRAEVQRWFEERHPGAEFTGEDLRWSVYGSDLTEPHHHNVWGANAAVMLRRWLGEGRIERSGHSKALLPKSHARSYPLYRKVR